MSRNNKLAFFYMRALQEGNALLSEDSKIWVESCKEDPNLHWYFEKRKDKTEAWPNLDDSIEKWAAFLLANPDQQNEICFYDFARTRIDDWGKMCETNPKKALEILTLTLEPEKYKKNGWPMERWQTALFQWNTVLEKRREQEQE